MSGHFLLLGTTSQYTVCLTRGGDASESLKVRTKGGWQSNIKANLKETVCEAFSGYAPLAGSCEHGNEPSGFITSEEFPDQLSDC
jgi:hypothetical protein